MKNRYIFFRWFIIIILFLFLLELLKYLFRPKLQEGIKVKVKNPFEKETWEDLGDDIEDVAKKAKDTFEDTGKQIGNTIISGSYELYQQVSGLIGDAGIGELIKLYDAVEDFSFSAKKSLVEIGNINNRLNSLPLEDIHLTDKQAINKFIGLGGSGGGKMFRDAVQDAINKRKNPTEPTPIASQPDNIQPIVTQPIVTQPIVTQPIVTRPPVIRRPPIVRS